MTLVAHEPDHRVSDADRDDVVERLRLACAEGRLTLEEFSDRVGEVYEARTGAELAEVTADLPVVVEPPEPVRHTRWVVGVLSGTRRSGPWHPARETRVVAILGSCQLDLTTADLEPVTEIMVVSLLGGVEILVPEGVGVDLGGFALLGALEDRTTGHPHGGPVVRVTSRALLGGVTVRTRPFR
jgi:DUF1707 SHOCT-like domain